MNFGRICFQIDQGCRAVHQRHNGFEGRSFLSVLLACPANPARNRCHTISYAKPFAYSIIWLHISGALPMRPVWLRSALSQACLYNLRALMGEEFAHFVLYCCRQSGHCVAAAVPDDRGLHEQR